MHRLSFDPTSRRLRVLGVLVIAAVLVAVALLREPAGRDASTTSVAPRDPAAGMAAPGDDSVVATEPVLDGEVAAPATDALGEQLAELAPAERAPVGGVVDGAADAAGGGTTSVAPEPAGGLAPPGLDARLVRSGSVELRVPRRRFERAWGDVQSIATSTGGYVIGASRSGAGDSARRATITMRIPGARFEAALERLRGLRGAEVARLDVSSQDVTQEFVDTRSRLRHDRAVEGRLLALLAEAEGVGEVLAVQARLDAVQQQVEVARGRLEYLERLTEMGTVEVSLVTPSAAGGDDRDEPSALGEAFDDAAERFVENVAGAVVWVGGALPSLLVLAIVGAVARFAWRRRTAPARLPSDPA